jgi:quinol monooxygenase YgiN
VAQQQVIARYTLLPGTEDEVLGLVALLAGASNAEPGCVSYAAFRCTPYRGEA